MNLPSRPSQSGSALLISLFVITILSLLLGGVLIQIRVNANTLNQAISWQQALVAAEAGVQQAAAQVQAQFVPLLNLNTPPDLTGTQSNIPAVSGTLTNSGEGNVSATFGYVLSGTKGSKGTSFRVLSTGTAQVAGTKFVGHDGRDAVLRKLTFTSNACFATRQIEAWFAPDRSAECGLVTNGTISMNNHNITVDSFDSSSYNNADPTLRRSEPNKGPNAIIGYYNSKAINNSNGGVMGQDYFYADIGTNGQLITAGGAYIYGDAMTNGGVATGTVHVSGSIYNDFYQLLAPVKPPTETFQAITMPNKGTTLLGGTKDSPTRYKVDSVSVTGNNAKLTFDFGTVTSGTATDPNKNYIELYITGNFNTKGGGNGDGSIVINSGVNVKIYVGGNIGLGGNGIANNNGSASSLSILGITPPAGVIRTADFGGTSTFYGTVYAPGYDITLGGTPTYIGSMIGKSATLVGNVAIRYDEALNGKLPISRYKIVSWFENTKKVP